MKNQAEQIRWDDGIQSVNEKRQIKRMAILRVGAKAFNQNGFSQTSLNSIATQLNVTKPSLYYYVKNKDDILIGILEIAAKQLRELIENTAVSAEQGLPALRTFFEAYGRIVTDDFGACLILMRINAPEDKFRRLYHGLSSEVLTAVTAIISRGIVDGTIAECDAKYMASAMLGTMNETVYWYLIEGRESPQDTAVRFFELFEQGLLPRN
ncbi:MAG: TetR/AcrR family transcriptional regulator [Chloroflexota bacterium]